MKGFTLFSVSIITMYITVLSSEAFALERCDVWAAKIQSLQGTVETKSPENQKWQTANLNQTLCSGDSVRLSVRSRAAIRLQNETILRLNENSQIILSSVSRKESSWIELLKGVAHFISRTPKSLEIKTPFVNAAIDGTEFVVEVNSDNSRVTVFEGQVTVSNKEGKLVLTNNQSAVAIDGAAPQAKILLKPRDSVQWALYYPPIIDYQSSFITKHKVKEIIDAFFVNDITGAFSRLKQLPEATHAADRLVLEASLLMSVGQSSQATQILNDALEKLPNISSAYALKSIIALTQGDISSAQQFADKSNLINPASAVAKLALSYIAQANFDLQTARSLVREASMLSPDSPLVWARLSEMELSFEELDSALEAANKSVALAPDYVHTQVTLGFAQLYLFEPQNALKVFTRAQELAPYSPLANLGLGLSTIQVGDLNAGVKFLEDAVIMDPNNSLLRSYLGKGYYEQNRFKLAETELNIAKILDVNDPTPFLYSAVLLNSTNSPIEALKNLTRAIKLNDNQAVFRSRQLLDRDLAAQSANLSSIYRNIGLTQSSLIQSQKILNIDPSNFSAHQLLADTYQKMPRHEVAGESERLQAQLLQPTNIIAYAPKSIQSSIIFNPINLGLNYLKSQSIYLFQKDKPNVNLRMLSGANNTSFLNSSVSGTSNKFSYALNHQELKSDGFQINDYISQSQQSFFTQYAVSHKLNVQMEIAQENLKFGDIPSRISGKQLENTDYRSNLDKIDLGMRYKYSSNNLFLLSLRVKKSKDLVFNFTPYPALPPGFKIGGIRTEVESNIKSKIVEVQHIFQSSKYNIIFGGSFSSLDDRTSSEQIGILDDLSIPLPNTATLINSTTDTKNIYAYNYYYPSKLITIVSGLIFSQFNSKNIEKDVINPKLGLILQPMPNTHIRMAAFKTLKQSKYDSSTIAPTQIAGFNQLFDDIDASSFRTLGLALDQNIKNKYFWSLEVTKRNGTQPIISVGDNTSTDYNRDELNYRANLSLFVLPNLVLSSNFIRDKIDQELGNSNGSLIIPVSISTLSVPTMLRYSFNNNIRIGLTATYVDQKATFLNDENDLNKTTFFRDRFPTFDIDATYKFKNNKGAIMFLITNLLSEEMKYQSNFDSSTPRASPYSPKSSVYINLQLSF